MIKVLVNGARGKMGQEVVKAIQKEEDLKLVGQADIDDKLEDAIWFTHPNVVVDFTTPDVVKDNILRILHSKCHAVVGTTGLSQNDLKDIKEIAEQKNLGVIVCPNFAIGAVLMMKYSAEISKYMPTAEIIELHHDKKLDAPSGTAIKTAENILEHNSSINASLNTTSTQTIERPNTKIESRIPIHSIRLPGLIAHQEVIFGGLGQTLTVRHDSTSRESFMPGVMMAIKKAINTTGLIYGLENILFASNS